VATILGKLFGIVQAAWLLILE